MVGYAKVTVERVYEGGSVTVESYQTEPGEGNDVEVIGLAIGCVLSDCLGPQILAQAACVLLEGRGYEGDEQKQMVVDDFMAAAERLLGYRNPQPLHTPQATPGS